MTDDFHQHDVRVNLGVGRLFWTVVVMWILWLWFVALVNFFWPILFVTIAVLAAVIFVWYQRSKPRTP
jgi:membrane protein YdbS with pleckstrin-like domain